MRKLFLVSVLSFFSALAVAQTAPAAEMQPLNSAAAAPEVNIEAAARSFGNFLGRMVKAPVDVATSVASGVSEGFTGKKASASEASALAVITTPAAVVPATPVSSVGASLPMYVEPQSAKIPNAPKVTSFISERLAAAKSQMLALAVGKQAPAPVEDISLQPTASLYPARSN